MAKPNRDCFQKAFKDNALTIFTVLGVIGGAVLGLSLRASRYARTPNNSHSLFLNYCSSSTHRGQRHPHALSIIINSLGIILFIN
jgi:hypothetical protein